MRFGWILFTFLLPFCTTRHIRQGCYRENLCPIQTESCYPAILKCRNDTCYYRRFNSSNSDDTLVVYWFYDHDEQDCRQDDHSVMNVLYFRSLNDCQRLCLDPDRYNVSDLRDVTNQTLDENDELSETTYIQLKIDVPPYRIKELLNTTDSAEAEAIYKVQTDYFRKYRSHFNNFLNQAYQFMLDNWRTNGRKEAAHGFHG